MDLKRPSYQCAVRWTMQGLTESFSEKKSTVWPSSTLKLSIWTIAHHSAAQLVRF